VPAMTVILIGLDPTRTLVISQVLLSFGLPLTIYSLLRFTADRKKMGPLVNGPLTNVLLGAATALVSVLNIYLIVATIAG